MNKIKKRSIFFIISMLMISSAIAGAIKTENLNENLTSNQADVPIWRESFSWTYDMNIDCEMPYSGISFDGNIDDIFLEVQEVQTNKYKVNIDVPNQEIGTGSITIPIVNTDVSGPIKTTNLDGTIFIDKTTLGLKSGLINIKGYFDKLIDVNFDLELDLKIKDIDENNAVFSTLDFPLEEDKEWYCDYRLLIIHYSGTLGPVTINSKTNDDLDPFRFWLGDFNYECTDVLDKNVDAGRFESYEIQRYDYDSTPNGKFWYSPDVGAVVEIDYTDIDLGSLLINDLSLELTDTLFSVPPEEPTQVSGPSTGQPREGPKYTYTARGGNDPDNDQVKYGFDFNQDNNVDKWTDFVSSGSQASVEYSYNSDGTKKVKAKTKDEKGMESGWSDEITVTIYPNDKPGTPTIPTGQQSGIIGSSYQYSSTEVIDPEGDNPVKYQFDWGDGETSNWKSNPEASHTYKTKNVESDTYTIKVRAKDCYGKRGSWSDGLTVTMTNSKPSLPATPTGTESGSKETKYTYNAITDDPENHKVYYKFDWGDGSISEWKGPYNPNEQGEAEHSFEKGNYQIKVKAKDEYNLETEWSEPLQVSMPKVKTINNNLINRLIERFLFLRIFRILPIFD